MRQVNASGRTSCFYFLFLLLTFTSVIADGNGVAIPTRSQMLSKTFDAERHNKLGLGLRGGMMARKGSNTLSAKATHDSSVPATAWKGLSWSFLARSAVAGALTGTVLESVLYPIETIKTRMQVSAILLVFPSYCPCISFKFCTLPLKSIQFS